MVTSEQLRAIHAKKKVPSRKNKNVLLHPDLAENEKGYNFSAQGFGVMSFGDDKEFAKRDRDHLIKLGVKVGKLRFGRRRRIDSTFGLHKRFQESSAGGRLPPEAIGTGQTLTAIKRLEKT